MQACLHFCNVAGKPWCLPAHLPPPCPCRRPITPVMLDYKVQADDKSMYNTPPCWSIYIAGLVFAKMRADGGLAAALANNEKVGMGGEGEGEGSSLSVQGGVAWCLRGCDPGRHVQ